MGNTKQNISCTTLLFLGICSQVSGAQRVPLSTLLKDVVMEYGTVVDQTDKNKKKAIKMFISKVPQAMGLWKWPEQIRVEGWAEQISDQAIQVAKNTLKSRITDLVNAIKQLASNIIDQNMSQIVEQILEPTTTDVNGVTTKKELDVKNITIKPIVNGYNLYIKGNGGQIWYQSDHEYVTLFEVRMKNGQRYQFSMTPTNRNLLDATLSSLVYTDDFTYAPTVSSVWTRKKIDEQILRELDQASNNYRELENQTREGVQVIKDNVH